LSVFADLKIESVVQVADKTRLDTTRSFVAKGSSEIQSVEINPNFDADLDHDAEGNDENFIDVTGEAATDWYLDWAYTRDVSEDSEDDGSRFVAVRITRDGGPAPDPTEENPEPAEPDDEVTIFTKSLSVLTEAEDKQSKPVGKPKGKEEEF
jgi:hypothetical protein